MPEKLSISDYSRFELRQPTSGAGEPFVVASNETGSKQRLLTDAEILSSYGHDPTMSDWKNHIQEHLTRGETGEEPIPEAGATESINDGPETVTETTVIDRGWKKSKALRNEAAKAEYVPRIKGRRDEMPYPTALHAFEATPDVEALKYHYGGILTIDEDGERSEEQVTVIGNPGVAPDGKSYVRTKEHGIVPSEQVRSLKSEIGIDTTRFVLAGIGPALYWKKVKQIEDTTGETPGLTKRLLNKFAESHPGLQRVGEAATSWLIKDPENSGVYSFKEIAERDMQAGRDFYMARPVHPAWIWATARNYDGSVNEKRKKELYDQREIGIGLQKEIGPRSAKEALFHTSKLFRPELNKLDTSILVSLGGQAVAFANLQRIANDEHIELTNRQWAISLMNGKKLTDREARDFKRYRTNGGAYRANGVSPYPRTATVVG